MDIAQAVSIAGTFYFCRYPRNYLQPRANQKLYRCEKNYLVTGDRTYIIAIVVAAAQINCVTYNQLTLNPN